MTTALVILGLIVAVPLMWWLTVAPDSSDVEFCERCEQFDEEHGPQCPEHPDHDPSPYCNGGHRGPKDCDCGPIAE